MSIARYDWERHYKIWDKVRQRPWDKVWDNVRGCDTDWRSFFADKADPHVIVQVRVEVAFPVNLTSVVRNQIFGAI